MNIEVVSYVDVSVKDARKVHLFEIWKNISKRHNVRIWLPNVKKKVNFPDIKIHYIRVLPIRFMKSAVLDLCLFVRLSWSIIKRHPDIIYVRDRVFINTPFFIGKLFKIPVVTEVNGILIDEFRMLYRYKQLLLPILIPFIKWRYRVSNFITAVTEGLRKYLHEEMKVCSSKIDVIPNGANTDLFRPISLTEVLPKTGLSPVYRYIGFVGNLAKWQGVDILLDAFSELSEYKNVKLLIVGGGHRFRVLKNLASSLEVSDKVIFTGDIQYEQVPYYINCCEFMIAPFAAERNVKIGLSPLKIYEYLACGKPVIASHVRGLEFIKTIGCGFLVDVDSPDALSIKLKEMLSMNFEKRKKMGQIGRDYVCRYHSWEMLAKKVEAILENSVYRK